MTKPIHLKKVREHNLKNISLELPPGEFIVFSGVSGSGKSSLAFDTLYSEGQRRYVESLSAFARRRMGPVHKPDLESAENLTPTISIEQKTVSKNPRSTVGTITELHDFLRILFARVGTARCPVTHKPLIRQSREAIFEQIQSEWKGERAIILAPFAKAKKGEFLEAFNSLRSKGFLRARIDGTLVDLDEEITLDKNKAHTIDVVIDRLLIGPEEKGRLHESIETALTEGHGLFSLYSPDTGREALFSTEGYSPATGESFAPLEPGDFSFNSPNSFCERCRGLGKLREFDLSKIIDPDKSVREDCCLVATSYNTVRYKNVYDNLAKLYDFSVKKPWKKLSEEAKAIVLFGNNQKWTRMNFVHPETGKRWFEFVAWKGVLHEAMERYEKATSDSYKEHFESLMHRGICTACGGSRIKPYPAATELGGKTLHALGGLAISDLKSFFDQLKLNKEKAFIAAEPLKEIHQRLSYLIDVGLGYLSMNREAPSLSGGEAQRVRLAALIGSGLVGVTYILDEPTIGLHPKDNQKLINTLRALNQLGNTIIVVEHDEEMMASADHLVDIGPGAGVEGGRLLFQGAPYDLKKSEESLTADYLFQRKKIFSGKLPRRVKEKWLTVTGCTHNNLKAIDVSFPLECFVAITGVSGSGKSSLISETLYPALTEQPAAYKALTGQEAIDKVILIDQSPIGRIPRSNPATYVKLFDLIRDLYSELSESKARGYAPGRFSFNVKEGCCSGCEGMGQVRIDMDFLEEQWTTCEQCEGKRFDEETLQIRYKGQSIADILSMTVNEAHLFFAAHPSITRKLQLLQQVGLGYMRLGQPSTTLSGGEAQRVKLAKELSKLATGRTLYILDEPTTGLHFHDIDQLLKVLHTLVDRKNSVVVIEHNKDLIQSADWIIDLGPEGGDRGGFVMATGTPEEVALLDNDTGRALRHKTVIKKKKKPKPFESEEIIITKAAENNLQEVSLTIPRQAITVCSGPSGSGKSSLAFDTLYAEGQRRYAESLSPYARQFVTACKKPKVEKISGLSPAIAIEQKASSGNPRSTVGTLTEIYDFLRILWAHKGEAYSPETGAPIRSITKESVANRILNDYPGQLVMILSPIEAPADFQELQEGCERQGIRRLFLNGKIVETDEKVAYNPKRKNQLMLVIDRLKIEPINRTRLLEAIEKASASRQQLYTLSGDTLTFHNLTFADETTGKSYTPLTPHSFSFNSKEGMCESCFGLGCSDCHFERLKPLARHVLVQGLSIGAFCKLPLEQALKFIQKLDKEPLLAEVLKQIEERLTFLNDVGLSYLSIDRTAPTLSNGEAQRIRLARQLACGLTNILYVLDEPTVGLHAHDIDQLNKALIRLKTLGNTLVLVEHDPKTIAIADWIVDMGPGAGKLGGHITAQGTYSQILKAPASLTGQYLSGAKIIPPLPKENLTKKSWLQVKKASANNLKKISPRFPLQAMTAITGVSGAGKSTLLYQVLAEEINLVLNHESSTLLEGYESISRLVVVDQNPLGQTNRADVATYTDLLTPLRELFATLPEARARGLMPKHFSPNHPSGMCPSCNGQGRKTISMLFMPAVEILCKECHGARLKPQALAVLFKGQTLTEILSLPVDEALPLLDSQPKVAKRLKALQTVGLGYLPLDQDIASLSGGEAQRVKLCRELSSRTKNCLYLLDEPTNGLHSSDIALLLPVLKRLVDQGGTVILVEHHDEVITQCDYVITLGPGAGEKGGHLL